MRVNLVMILLACLTVGCASFEDYHYNCVKKIHANQAWRTCQTRADKQAVSSDFAQGWRNGYFEVSVGGTGEPPPVPPQKYWSPKFQNPAGQQAISDWYAGYQDGATAATQNGAEYWNRLTTGPGIAESYGYAPESYSQELGHPYLPGGPYPPGGSYPPVGPYYPGPELPTGPYSPNAPYLPDGSTPLPVPRQAQPTLPMPMSASPVETPTEQASAPVHPPEALATEPQLPTEESLVLQTDPQLSVAESKLADNVLPERSPPNSGSPIISTEDHFVSEPTPETTAAMQNDNSGLVTPQAEPSYVLIPDKSIWEMATPTEAAPAQGKSHPVSSVGIAVEMTGTDLDRTNKNVPGSSLASEIPEAQTRTQERAPLGITETAKDASKQPTVAKKMAQNERSVKRYSLKAPVLAVVTGPVAPVDPNHDPSAVVHLAEPFMIRAAEQASKTTLKSGSGVVR